MFRKFLKMLHEVGAVGVMGSIASCMVLVATAPAQSLVEFAVLRQAIVQIEQWMFLPSLILVLTSGLLAIAVNEAYINSAWPWFKALLGLSMFEGSLLTVSSRAREAAELSALAVRGQGNPVQLAEALRSEWGGLWIISALALANVVLAVWRPRSVAPRSET